MNDLMTISGVRGFIDENGTAQLNLEDCARGLGFTETKGDYIRWQRIDGYLNDFKFSTSGERPKYIPENIFYRLAMKAKNETAEKFQAKVADEILPAIRKTGSYSKQLSPLEILAAQANALVIQEKKLKEIAERQEKSEKAIQGMRDVVALSSASWRRDTGALINRMAKVLGGNEHIQPLRKESYKLLNERMGVSLPIRLTNMRCRMAQEGISRAKRDKVNYLDVIDKDKKLIEGYVAIIKDMSIKYGVTA